MQRHELTEEQWQQIISGTVRGSHQRMTKVGAGRCASTSPPIQACLKLAMPCQPRLAPNLSS